MTTICSECTHLHGDSHGPPWYWLCSRHPRMEGFGFVTRKIWDKFPPFLFCRDVNGGACPLYEEKENDESIGSISE